METLVLDIGLAVTLQKKEEHTLPETNIAPENGWLEY